MKPMTRLVNFVTFVAMLTIAVATLNTSKSWARAGGGRSFGGRGFSGFSRSSGGGSNSYNRSGSFGGQQSTNPQNQPYNSANTARPSFLGSLGTGMAGGFLGSMLFNSFRGTGSAYPQGSGIGLIEILMLAGLAFAVFQIYRNKRQNEVSSQAQAQGQNLLFRNSQTQEPQTTWQKNGWGQNTSNSTGATALRLVPLAALDSDAASDLFFKIQGAFTQRDLQPVRQFLTPEVYDFLNNEVETLKQAHRFNRLENIAVRNAEVTETWGEGELQFATVWFKASLLDYAVDETTKQVVEGNATTPIKFEEYWTFVAAGQDAPQWRLSAIQQA